MKILIAAVAALLVISCNYGKEKSDLAANVQKLEENKSAIPDAASANEVASADTASASPQQKQKDLPGNVSLPSPKIDWDKKIIKTASLNAEVHNYDSFYSSLRERVRNVGGYVAQEEQNRSDYKIENTITVKVPVDQFDNAITSLTAGTEKVNERKVTSQDVTTEVVDTKSRIETKKEVRLKYIDLLKQAKDMSEILSVQSEINGIQEQIESAAGRINYLSHSSAFSTINFTFYQVLNATAKDYEEPSFWTKISTSFKTGWQWMGELIAGIVSVWPLILFIIVIWVVVKRYTRSTPSPSSVSK